MKLALVNTTPEWGGGERWFLDAAVALRQRGHAVLLFAEGGSPLHERCQAIAPDAAMAKKELRRICKDHPPDVVLVNSGRDLRFALKGVSKKSPIRFVMRRGIDRPLNDHFLRRPSWKRLSAILVNSDATGCTIRQSLRWFPSDRVRRIYNPVTLDARERVPRAEGQPLRLGTVARLVRQKGHATLLDAVAKLDGLDWTLDLAGDGKLRPSIEAQIAKLGLGDRVRLHGHVDDLPAFYANLDVALVPSLYEGFGFVAAEAALASLPVIATNVSSLPEIVRHEETGLLVPVGDADALATAIRRLAEDPPLANALGDRARELALERFGLRDLTDRLEVLLHEAKDWPATKP